MNKKKCSKCKKIHYCDKHHVLPQALFVDSETDYLCKNCHDEFHRYLGHKFLRKQNKQPEQFYFEKYLRWLVGLSIVFGILVLSAL